MLIKCGCGDDGDDGSATTGKTTWTVSSTVISRFVEGNDWGEDDYTGRLKWNGAMSLCWLPNTDQLLVEDYGTLTVLSDPFHSTSPKANVDCEGDECLRQDCALYGLVARFLTSWACWQWSWVVRPFAIADGNHHLCNLQAPQDPTIDAVGGQVFVWRSGL